MCSVILFSFRKTLFPFLASGILGGAKQENGCHFTLDGARNVGHCFFLFQEKKRADCSARFLRLGTELIY